MLDDQKHYFKCSKLWTGISTAMPAEYGLELLNPTSTQAKINNPGVTKQGARLAFRLGLFATSAEDFLPVALAFRIYHDSRNKFRPGNHTQDDIHDAAVALLRHLRDLRRPTSTSTPTDPTDESPDEIPIAQLVDAELPPTQPARVVNERLAVVECASSSRVT